MSKYPEIHDFDGAEYIRCADFDRVTAERDAALAENKLLRHDVASYLETVAKVCDMLGVDLESAKSAEGKPSDVLFSYIGSMQQRLTAADERADVLEGLLRRVHKSTALTKAGDLWRQIDAALKPAEVRRNQCDGCQAGIPVVNGAHRMGKHGGYADTMSCTAKMYVEERPDGCCCPPKGHTGLWGAAMCPVHQGLRALKR